MFHWCTYKPVGPTINIQHTIISCGPFYYYHYFAYCRSFFGEYLVHLVNCDVSSTSSQPIYFFITSQVGRDANALSPNTIRGVSVLVQGSTNLSTTWVPLLILVSLSLSFSSTIQSSSILVLTNFNCNIIPVSPSHESCILHPFSGLQCGP